MLLLLKYSTVYVDIWWFFAMLLAIGTHVHGGFSMHFLTLVFHVEQTPLRTDWRTMELKKINKVG